MAINIRKRYNIHFCLLHYMPYYIIVKNLSIFANFLSIYQYIKKWLNYHTQIHQYRLNPGLF